MLRGFKVRTEKRPKGATAHEGGASESSMSKMKKGGSLEEILTEGTLDKGERNGSKVN